MAGDIPHAVGHGMYRSRGPEPMLAEHRQTRAQHPFVQSYTADTPCPAPIPPGRGHRETYDYRLPALTDKGSCRILYAFVAPR